MNREEVDLKDFVPVNIEDVPKNKYFISPDGRVYSDYIKAEMHSRPDKDGYLFVTFKAIEHRRKTVFVHQLVAKHFIGDPPKDMENPTVDHMDKNRQNNLVSNLQWQSRAENSSDRGETNKGHRNCRSKLTSDEVIEISELLMTRKFTPKRIAELYYVSPATIRNIQLKKNWSWLTKDYDFNDYMGGENCPTV